MSFYIRCRLKTYFLCGIELLYEDGYYLIIDRKSYHNWQHPLTKSIFNPLN
ncbi:hypothetical protein GMMP13_370004 [Candidatus Magnetomoraceae bacterium gMMP-13]